MIRAENIEAAQRATPQTGCRERRLPGNAVQGGSGFPEPPRVTTPYCVGFFTNLSRFWALV